MRLENGLISLWFLTFISLIQDAYGFIEEGFLKKTINLHKSSENNNISFTKSMYKDSDIMFTIHCDGNTSETFSIKIFYVQRSCDHNHTGGLSYDVVKCQTFIKLNATILKTLVPGINPNLLSNKVNKDSSEKNLPPTEKRSQRKRKNADSVAATATENNNAGENYLPKTKSNAVYIVVLRFESQYTMKLNVKIRSKYKGSFLSAINWPLLPFYGVMSLLYVAYAVGWLIATCCNWRDLLRLQFWIGGVIALGMFENALSYAEFSYISHHGTENGLLYFAEVVSCLKKSLARILVIIVSMGFGIVKPRLGQTLHKVLAVGGLYFVLALIEGCVRLKNGNALVNFQKTMYALIPVILLDVGICWWVFTSLVQTTRTLRIRKNAIKLTLYRHFSNTIIFAVVASLAYMVWMIIERKKDCINIGNIWLDDAIWPFLFAIILAVIMILWRPSQNNQRYAFTPLDIGDSDDENDEMTLSEAFDGMKMRSKSESHREKIQGNRHKAEDDLKWVEENIPSVPSTLLPTLDSDEEIIMTKFETSKMD